MRNDWRTGSGLAGAWIAQRGISLDAVFGTVASWAAWRKGWTWTQVVVASQVAYTSASASANLKPLVHLPASLDWLEASPGNAWLAAGADTAEWGVTASVRCPNGAINRTFHSLENAGAIERGFILTTAGNPSIAQLYDYGGNRGLAPGFVIPNNRGHYFQVQAVNPAGSAIGRHYSRVPATNSDGQVNMSRRAALTNNVVRLNAYQIAPAAPSTGEAFINSLVLYSRALSAHAAFGRNRAARGAAWIGGY